MCACVCVCVCVRVRVCVQCLLPWRPLYIYLYTVARSAIRLVIAFEGLTKGFLDGPQAITMAHTHTLFNLLNRGDMHGMTD